MDALSGAIARLLRRQEESERRLAEIEKALGIARAPAPDPAPPTPPRVKAPPALPVDLQPELQAPPPVHSPPPRTDGKGLETRLGLAWVNRVGVVTVALFVAFFFKYAVDSAWIG